ncbi:MAG: Holliday junction resolvase RuvX [Pyrinomonadaceae bacterium]
MQESVQTIPTSSLRGRRIVAIDPGTRRCGAAVSDELHVTIRRLPFIERTSWKRLLTAVAGLVEEFDAAALVIGLPLNTDGSESEMSAHARDLARKFTLSLKIPVYLQDERVTSYEARGRLWESGLSPEKARKMVDSEAAAIILADFLDRISVR